MAIINITDKLSSTRPQIQIGEKTYEVNNSMAAVFNFEGLASTGTATKMKESMELALGKDAVAEIDVMAMSLENFKVLSIAVMAAMQGLTFEKAEARFRKAEQ